MRKIIISESEKKNILKLYGIKTLLKEIEIKPGESISTKILFKGGYFSQNQGNFEDLNNNITEIVSFCNNVPNGKIIEVVVEAGESQIPNVNREKNAERVDIGFLSTSRYSTIKTFISNKLNLLKKNDPNFKKPNKFVETTPKIGITKWLDNPEGFCPSSVVKTLDPKDTQGYSCLSKDFNLGNNKVNWANGKDTTYNTVRETFLSEQFVKVMFKVTTFKNPEILKSPASEKCLTNMIIEYNYDSVVEKSNSGANVHCCSRGKFNLTLNGVTLKRSDGLTYANINNHPSTLDKQDINTKDTRIQSQAGIANYQYKILTGSDKGKLIGPTPLCVNITDNGINQNIDVPTYVKNKSMNNFRYNTFKITSAIAKQIVLDAKGVSGFLTLNVSPADINPHKEAARIIVKDPQGVVYYDSCVNGDCGNKNIGDFSIPYCNTQKL